MRVCVLSLLLLAGCAAWCGEPAPAADPKPEPPKADTPKPAAAEADPWATAEAMIERGPDGARQAVETLDALLPTLKDNRDRMRAYHLLAMALMVRTGSVRAVVNGLEARKALKPFARHANDIFREIANATKTWQAPAKVKDWYKHPVHRYVRTISIAAEKPNVPKPAVIARPRRIEPYTPTSLHNLPIRLNVRTAATPASRAYARDRSGRLRFGDVNLQDAEMHVLIRCLDRHLAEARKRRTEAGLGLAQCAGLLQLPLSPRLQGEILLRTWSYYIAEDPRRDFQSFMTWVQERTPLPKTRETRLPLARVANQARDYAACLDLVRPLLDANEPSATQDDCLLLAGTASARLERIPGAFQYLNQLVEEYPTSPQTPRALLLLGWAHLVQGDYKKATEPLEQLLKRFPRDRNTRPARRLLDGIATRLKERQELF